LKPRIIVAGSGALTAEISETALLIGYEVINLNPRDETLLIGDKIKTLHDITEDLFVLPIIMSSTEYPESKKLSFDKNWVHNHKKLLRHTESLGFRNWTTIIHPSAVISPSAKIGVNIFVNANSTISSNSKVSDHTQINRNVSIGHDVTIGSFCNIAPGVTVTGLTFIQDSVFIGAGSIIINGVSVGDSATIAAGSLVIKNVNESSFVVGSPAKQKNVSYRKWRRKLIMRVQSILEILGILPLVTKIYYKIKY
jgi:sugar O-acyltransferase (sialic acid O-acetyltransferase NeuD family)